MDIIDSDQSGAFVLNPEGCLDVSNADILKEKLEAYAAKRGVKIIINMSNLEYVSPSGWAAISELALKVRRRGGNIVFSSMNDLVSDVFHSLGLNDVLEAFKTDDEAIKNIGAF